MIDHLNIPSRTIEVESDIGKNQVSKFGIHESFAGVGKSSIKYVYIHKYSI